MSSGGPLLCIGDLLRDVGEGSTADSPRESIVSGEPSSSIQQPLDLQVLFEANYNQLNAALESSDHSWTGLTLKLCSVLETADKLVKEASTRARLLVEKVDTLEKVLGRENSVVSEAKAVFATPRQWHEQK
ncbi:hypothetical protein EJ110_NYTH40502 [Nymphaea thermarum]|nr:hypothetical protein EJ110_NYTH40502 [Nymphaea thermarum]